MSSPQTQELWIYASSSPLQQDIDCIEHILLGTPINLQTRLGHELRLSGKRNRVGIFNTTFFMPISLQYNYLLFIHYQCKGNIWRYCFLYYSLPYLPCLTWSPSDPQVLLVIGLGPFLLHQADFALPSLTLPLRWLSFSQLSFCIDQPFHWLKIREFRSIIGLILMEMKTQPQIKFSKWDEEILTFTTQSSNS